MTQDPCSAEALDELRVAYRELPEKNKRRLLRVISEREQKLFAKWKRESRLPGGASHRKIIARENGYGELLDESLIDAMGVTLGTDIIGRFLTQEGHLGAFKNTLLEMQTQGMVLDEVDEAGPNSDDDGSPIARLTGAFVACYMQGDSPGPPPPELHEVGLPSLEQMKEHHKGLDEQADRIVALAESIRSAQDVDVGEAVTTIQTACITVRAFREMLAEASSRTGLGPGTWDSADGLLKRMEEITETLEANERKKGVADFLCELADDLRALAVSHRSSRTEKRLLRERDRAVDEVAAAATSETVRWVSQDVLEGPSAWLRAVAAEENRSELSATQDALEDAGYPVLADFVGEILPEWISLVDSEETAEGTLDQQGPAKLEGGARLEDDPQEASEPQAGSAPELDGPEWPDGSANTPVVPPEADADVAQVVGSGDRDGRESEEQKGKILTEEEMGDIRKPMSPPASTPAICVSNEDRDPEGDEKTQGDGALAPGKGETMAAAETEEASAPEASESCPEDIVSLPDGAPGLCIDEGADMSLTDAAQALAVAEDAQDQAHRARRLAWMLLGEGQPALAYHLVSAARSVAPAGPPVMPAWVPEVLALLSSAGPDQYAVQQHLQKVFSSRDETEFGSELTPEWTLCTQLLFVATALRPAITCPAMNAGVVLKSLSLGDIPELHELVQAALTFTQRGITPGRKLLIASLSDAEWKGERAQLLKKTRDWSDGAPSFRLSYAPATQVWQEWLKPDGFVRDFLDAVGREDETSLKALQETLQEIDIADAIERTRRSHLGRANRMVGIARRQLKRHAEEAIDLAQQWLDLVDVRPQKGTDFARDHIGRLREALERTYQKAVDAVAEATDGAGQTHPCRIAGEVLKRELDAVHRLFHGDQSRPRGSARDPEAILGQALLRITGIAITDGVVAADSPEILLAKVGQGLSAGLPSWRDAFESYCSLHDHRSSRLVIEALRQEGTDPALLEEMEGRRLDQIGDLCNDLRVSMANCTESLGKAVGRGLVTPESHDELSVTVDRLRKQLDDGVLADEGEFHRYFEQLHCVQTEVDAGRTQGLARTKERLGRGKGATAEQTQQIQEALDNGDVYLANEYLDRLEDGKPLPPRADDTEQEDFQAFFVIERHGGKTAFEMVQKRLSQQPANHRELVESVSSGTEVAGIPLEGLARNQSAPFAEVLKKWFMLHRASRVSNVQDLRDILNGLGFVLRDRLERNQKSGARTWLFRTDTTPRCPVPQFGSEAHRQYTLICDFSQSSPGDLVDVLRRQSMRSALIIFYFGRLDAERRRELAHICRRQRKTLLLVDDILMVYLATVQGPKLDALFQCALPFTSFMPYSSTASLLPPEVFFGRRREIEALESTTSNGSCFLYGGRQIGKTVLLKHVQRRVHRPGQGQIAKYIELKVNGIGLNRSVDDLWEVLYEGLEGDEVPLLTEKRPRRITAAFFRRRTVEWLTDDPQRRLLVLLDEADAFMESDGKGSGADSIPFGVCDQMRGLMVETELRFKVVLAGLHNVQRSTRVANNPLAHFGSPICVGPLLRDGEAREAEALIRHPLSALGIFFADTSLPIRILAQTNYYPNLIQIYCQSLLAHITEKQGFQAPDRTPPYVITSEDIDDVYERQELRYELREKFRLTLDLDRRFSLIAHLLALYETEFPDGMLADDIRRDTLEWWPNGFLSTGDPSRPLPQDAFRDLLDEMVGLGILRRTRDGTRYGLRSPNVSAMLGTKKQIEGVIEGAVHWEPPASYEPQTFRSLVNPDDSWLRSPFTAAQEATIRTGTGNVVLIAGCPAAGLDSIVPALCSSFGTDYVKDLEASADLAALEGAISDLSRRRKSGKTLIVVRPETPWSIEWMEASARRMKRFSSADSQVGLIFCCDPGQVWRMRRDWSRLEGLTTDTLYLHPWADQALRQWFDDSPLGSQTLQDRERVASVTGNWPLLLAEAAKEAKAQKSLEQGVAAVEEMITESSEAHRFQVGFGLVEKDALLVLGVLSAYDDAASEAELSELSEDEDGSAAFDEDMAAEVMSWAERLDLVTATQRGWRIDPVVGKIVLSLRGE
jgi:hypothetical protein